tara:strand:- start:5790 stop:6233 length:444 start_codon:yes stop_codon:yes gene_type:complete
MARTNPRTMASNNPFQSPPRPHSPQARMQNLMSGKCVEPTFSRDLDYSGRECAGTQINENKLLRLGDHGCDVLLLQQRLNRLELDKDLLTPTGKFCCKTKSKLVRVMGVPEISLNQFQAKDQTGFDELQGGTQITPYSYMDVNKINR